MYNAIMNCKDPYNAQNPLVSVIVPVYQAADTLVQTLDSIFSQDYPNMEVIAVNDGSPDNSFDILRAYDSHLSKSLQAKLTIMDQKNAGVSTARNYGVAQSTGRFIAFMDADDLWEPDKTLKQVQQLIEADDPDNSFSSTFTDIFDHPPGMERKLNGFCQALNGQDHFSNPSGWMLSRVLFDRIGGFDTVISAMEDQDFLTNLARYGAELLYVDEPLTWYRWPADDKTYNNWQESHWRYFEKHAHWLQDNLSAEGFEEITQYYSKGFGEDRVALLLAQPPNVIEFSNQKG